MMVGGPGMTTQSAFVPSYCMGLFTFTEQILQSRGEYYISRGCRVVVGAPEGVGGCWG